MALTIKVLTLFPEMVRTVLGTSILGRAAQQGQVVYEVTDIRDFAVDKHRTVDDTPYGGGAGMIMMAPCVVEAVEAVRGERGRAGGADDAAGRDAGRGADAGPAGRGAGRGRADPGLRALQGRRRAGARAGDHARGVDRRLRAQRRRAAGAGHRRRAGAAGRRESCTTRTRRRPTASRTGAKAVWTVRGTRSRRSTAAWRCREVLLSGHHAKIEAWRREQARQRTRERRPDLGRPPGRRPRATRRRRAEEQAVILTTRGRVRARRGRRPRRQRWTSCTTCAPARCGAICPSSTSGTPSPWPCGSRKATRPACRTSRAP